MMLNCSMMMLLMMMMMQLMDERDTTYRAAAAAAHAMMNPYMLEGHGDDDDDDDEGQDDGCSAEDEGNAEYCNYEVDEGEEEGCECGDERKTTTKRRKKTKLMKNTLAYLITSKAMKGKTLANLMTRRTVSWSSRTSALILQSPNNVAKFECDWIRT